MAVSPVLLILIFFLGLSACFSRTEKSPVVVTTVVNNEIDNKISAVSSNSKPKKDSSLGVFAKLFDQADAIHREAWWVLTSERRPISKSPFGKVQRALLSYQGMKLSNKSLFSCDRYVVRRDILNLDGFPQKAEIFEKCSEKITAKKIAQFVASSPSEMQVTFFPESLEEILGLGAAVLNRAIECKIKSNDQEQLIELNCKEWAQDRTKEQMIRLDIYDYKKEGRNIIKLRGKVYENLSDTKKIEADVPLEGKIFVTETELYPPKPAGLAEGAASPTIGARAPIMPRDPEAPPLEITPEMEKQILNGQVPNSHPPVDPDVLMMQQNQQRQMIEQGYIEEPAPVSLGSAPGLAPLTDPTATEGAGEKTSLPQQPTAGGIYGR